MCEPIPCGACRNRVEFWLFFTAALLTGFYLGFAYGIRAGEEKVYKQAADNGAAQIVNYDGRMRINWIKRKD